MEILHLIWDSLNNPWIGGGGAIRTHEINRRIASRHSITVLTGNYPNAAIADLDGVRYRSVGCGKSHLLSLLSYSLVVPRYIRRSHFDLVVDDFCAYSPVFAPLHTRQPVIAVTQNLFRSESIRKHPLLGSLAYLLEEVGPRIYQHHIAVSPHLGLMLRQKAGPEASIAIINNAPDPSLLRSQPRESNYILYIGRLEIFQKGLDVLIKAFGNVVGKVPGIKLKLAGPLGKRDRKQLHAMIRSLDLQDSVEFVGVVSGRKKVEMMSHCLFVCMPSRFEGWPIVAIEAAACQKPVIGTSIPGLRDAVRDGETGMLVIPDSPAHLSQAMVALILDAELRATLGEGGRQWAGNFSWDNLALEQETYYRKVVGHC